MSNWPTATTKCPANFRDLRPFMAPTKSCRWATCYVLLICFLGKHLPTVTVHSCMSSAFQYGILVCLGLIMTVLRVRRRRRTKGNNKDNVTRTFDLHSCLPCNGTLSTILLHGSQLVWFASSQKLGLINLFVKHILQTHKTQKYAIHIHKVKHPSHQWSLILSLLKYMSKVHTVMYVGCESSLPLWCIHRIVRGYGKDTCNDQNAFTLHNYFWMNLIAPK